jgi:hypothetical protein
MFKKFKLSTVVAVATICALAIGCAETSKHKAKKGNEKISEMRDVEKTLLEEDGIALSSSSRLEAALTLTNNARIDKMSDDELKRAEKRLARVVTLGNEIKDIADEDPSIRFEGESYISNERVHARSALDYLRKVKKERKKAAQS